MFTVELAPSVTTSMYTHSGTTPHGLPVVFFTSFAVTTASREDASADDPAASPTAANTKTATSRPTPKARYLKTRPTSQPYSQPNHTPTPRPEKPLLQRRIVARHAAADRVVRAKLQNLGG